MHIHVMNGMIKEIVWKTVKRRNLKVLLKLPEKQKNEEYIYC